MYQEQKSPKITKVTIFKKSIKPTTTKARSTDFCRKKRYNYHITIRQNTDGHMIGKFNKLCVSLEPLKICVLNLACLTL